MWLCEMWHGFSLMWHMNPNLYLTKLFVGDVMSGGWIYLWIVLPRGDFCYHESTITLNTEDVTASILKSIYGVLKSTRLSKNDLRIMGIVYSVALRVNHLSCYAFTWCYKYFHLVSGRENRFHAHDENVAKIKLQLNGRGIGYLL